MTTDIFAPEMVWSVAVPGLGRIFPRSRNVCPVICRRCGSAALSNAAVKLVARRRTNVQKGYLCIECASKVLRLTDWHFQQITMGLFPAQAFTMRPISGSDLADAFLREGERGLLTIVSKSMLPA